MNKGIMPYKLFPKKQQINMSEYKDLLKKMDMNGVSIFLAESLFDNVLIKKSDTAFIVTEPSSRDTYVLFLFSPNISINILE